MAVRLLQTIVLAICCVPASGTLAGQPIDFATDVLPVFTRFGCNSGACHGAAAGRGGFRLSLLGGDPSADYESVVREFQGRRVNLAKADRSLLLKKPTGDLDHGGEVLFDTDSPAAELIRRWIESGAPASSGRRMVSIDISPQRSIGQSVPLEIPLRVVATFRDGDETFQRDVTEWTVLTPNDPSAVTIDQGQIATVHRRGMHTVLARFLDVIRPISLGIPFNDVYVDDLAGAESLGKIDRHVNAVLVQLKLPTSPPADDATWIRRVTLDLTGRLPTINEAVDFQESDDPNKRRLLIDRLLNSGSYTEYWTLRLAKLFALHSLPNETAGTAAYADWIRSCVENDVGFDRIATELLTATGDSHQVGAANFARMVPDARAHAELVGRVFLGARIGCANCHDHPLDRWTQDDYHGLAAILAPLDRGRWVTMANRGAVTNPRTGQPATPRIPGYRDLAPDSADLRGELLRWMLDDNERVFAKAIVNRLWHAMLGRGLVDPVDDLRDTNPPTHPELFDDLAADFVAGGYSIRNLLRQIALSDCYGRGAAVDANASDRYFYSHRVSRPLMAEVLADAIADVTGVGGDTDNTGTPTRSVTILDPHVPSETLDILGRCKLPLTCGDSESPAPGLASQLHKLNGRLINAKLIDPAGRLRQGIADGASDEMLITQFFILAFSRPPTEQQRDLWLHRVRADNPMERSQKLEDFLWAILNSRAFSENH